jgi:hypothetical protein
LHSDVAAVTVRPATMSPSLRGLLSRARAALESSAAVEEATPLEVAAHCLDDAVRDRNIDFASGVGELRLYEAYKRRAATLAVYAVYVAYLALALFERPAQDHLLGMSINIRSRCTGGGAGDVLSKGWIYGVVTFLSKNPGFYASDVTAAYLAAVVVASATMLLLLPIPLFLLLLLLP